MTIRCMLSAAMTVVVAVLVLSRPCLGADDAPAFSRYLKGEFLVATPKIGDPRFARTVIIMIDHDASGAMGLIVNRAHGRGPLAKLLEGFEIEAGDVEGEVALHYGGPVSPGRGFVLHSDDYMDAASQKIADGVAVNSQRDVLEAIARGKGPRRVLFVLGYSGWAPMQLEAEMEREDWVSAPADAGLVFAEDPETVWERAFATAGVKM